jgi:hypothetical protein
LDPHLQEAHVLRLHKATGEEKKEDPTLHIATKLQTFGVPPAHLSSSSYKCRCAKHKHLIGHFHITKLIAQSPSIALLPTLRNQWVKTSVVRVHLLRVTLNMIR